MKKDIFLVKIDHSLFYLMNIHFLYALQMPFFSAAYLPQTAFNASK